VDGGRRPVSVADWTMGEPGLAVLSCDGCGNVWYFRRSFCPRCGRAGPNEVLSVGRGRVVATTVVHRAPSDEWRPLVPYALGLVHGHDGLAEPRVRHAHDGGVAHGGVLLEGLLDLFGEDLLAAGVDAARAPAEEHDRAVCLDGPHVAGHDPALATDAAVGGR